MSYPENYIERARQAISEKEEIRTTAHQLFNASIDLLREKGKGYRSFKIFKFQSVTHSVNTTEPPVRVRIESGANLDKANKVQIWIQEIGRIMIMRKRTDTGGNFSAFSWSNQLTGLEALKGVLAVVNQVAAEVRDS